MGAAAALSVNPQTLVRDHPSDSELDSLAELTIKIHLNAVMSGESANLAEREWSET